jgi:hypothetical protein
MKFKNFLVGMAAVVVFLGASQALAWDPSSVQRGWVDSIGNIPYPGFVVGPTVTMSIRGWACVRPSLYDYGVPPTQLAVSNGTQPLTILEVRQTEYRPDLVAYNACGGYYRGFIVWVAKPTSSVSNYYVAFLGPYGTTFLEGQSSY